jgi:hypothetical protein
VATRDQVRSRRCQVQPSAHRRPARLSAHSAADRDSRRVEELEDFVPLRVRRVRGHLQAPRLKEAVGILADTEGPLLVWTRKSPRHLLCVPGPVVAATRRDGRPGCSTTPAENWYEHGWYEPLEPHATARCCGMTRPLLSLRCRGASQPPAPALRTSPSGPCQLAEVPVGVRERGGARVLRSACHCGRGRRQRVAAARRGLRFLRQRTAIASTSIIIPGSARELTSSAVEAGGSRVLMNSFRTRA